jgi:hypothetical protein
MYKKKEVKALKLGSSHHMVMQVPTSDMSDDSMPICEQADHDDNGDTWRTADLPEISLRFRSVDNALEVHAIIGGEKGQGQEDDSDSSKSQYRLVLDVRNNGKLVLLNRTKLKQLEKIIIQQCENNSEASKDLLHWVIDVDHPIAYQTVGIAP